MADGGDNTLRRYSAGDLASALRISKQAVAQRAARGAWPYDTVTGRGGRRRLYPLAGLPGEVQAALLLRERPALPAAAKGASAGATWTEARIASVWDTYNRASSGPKTTAERRLHALHAVEALVAGGLGLMAARKAVAAQLQAENVRGCSAASLGRFQATVDGAPRDAWLAILLPEHVGRTAEAEADPRAWEWYKTQWLTRRRPSHADTYQRLQLIAATEGWMIASGKTYARRCDTRIEPYTVKYYREGAQAAARLLPPQVRDPLCYAAGEAVNGDGLKFDTLWVRFPDGEIINTATVWFWQDTRTRKILAWRLGKTECTDIFRLATYDLTAICAPYHVLMDNTRVAANKLMTAGAEGRHRYHDKPNDGKGLLQILGMEPHFTNPDKELGSPGAKSIERAFGKGGIHSKVATNTALAGRGYSKKTAITAAELQAVLVEEVARHNAQTGRRTAACGGVLSFDQAWDESVREHPPRVLPASQRNVLLMCRELVRPDKRSGAVTLKAGRSPNGVNRYHCDELARYMGRPLMAHFDPDDLSAGIHLYTLQGNYLFAAEHQATAAFNSTEAGGEHQKFKARNLKAKKRIAENERRMSDLEAQALYGRAAKPTPEPPAEPAGNVVTGHFAKVPNPARDAARPSATGTDGGVTQLDRFITRQSEKLAEDAL